MTRKELDVIRAARLLVRDMYSIDATHFEVVMRLRNLNRAVSQLEKVKLKK